MILPTTLVFLHVPRTGGTSLRRILSEVYPNRFLDAGYIPNESFVQTDLTAYSAIAGHFAYGIDLGRPCDYLTLLREPVDRVVSGFYFTKGTPSHYLYYEACARTLEDFVTSSNPSVKTANSNLQVRMLSGLQEPGAAAVEEAKKNLKRFRVVGIREQFAEVVDRCQRVFGWPEVDIPELNASSRASLSQIKPETLEAIRQQNACDIELYEWVREEFGYDCR